MKVINLLLLVIFSTFFSQAQNVNPLYDSTLAKNLGADDLGMKNYILVILKTGTAIIENSAVRDSLFRGHFDNMTRLTDMGKLIVAGPFGKNENSYRGIFILDVKTIEEARELVNTDPTVKEKIFEVEFYPWYGSAALPTHIEVHKRIGKKGI